MRSNINGRRQVNKVILLLLFRFELSHQYSVVRYYLGAVDL